MRSSWRRAGISWLFLLPACGGSPPPVVAPEPPPVAVAVAPETPSAPDLSPVPEPRGLLLVARWKAPAKSVDQILKLFGAQVSIESLIAKEGGDVGKLLDLDGSFDAAMILDPDSTDEEPKVLGAVSIPVRSFDDARANAEKETSVTVIRPGVVRLSPKKGEKEICDLTMASGQGQAAGSAPARLVCGGPKDVEALRGWLSRGLPAGGAEANALTATLRAGPLKDRYLARLRAEAVKAGDQARALLTAQNVGDPDLLSAPGIAMEEGLRFLEDLDRIEFRTSLTTTPPELQSSGAVRFSGRSSWLTRVITDVNDRSGPVPEMFWRAPRDAYSATWGRGSDPHLFDGVRGVLHKALGEALGRVPLIPAADKAALEGFLDGVPRAPGVWVSANGLLPSRKKPGAKGDAVANAKDLVINTLGWHVTGVEAPAAEYVAWARQGLDVYTRGVHLVRELAAAQRVVGKGTKKDAEMLELIPRVKQVSSPPGWPKGTIAFDVLLQFDSDLATLLLPRKAREAIKDATKKTPGAKGSLTVRLAIVPDGERTWIGFSADLDELKKRMNAVQSSAPREGTLATREGLEGLRQPGQTWGGFVGFGDLLERGLETVERESPKHGGDARALLGSLPNKGRTPLLLVGSGAAGQAPSSGLEVRLQSGSLADLTALVTFLASPRGREILKKID